MRLAQPVPVRPCRDRGGALDRTVLWRRDQQFTYLIDAVSTGGHRTRGTIRGTDTYGTTAVIAAESALCLTAEPARPGVLAPAQAYDPAEFLNSLTAHGIHWTIE
jgi:short subunit dehydrogenase-like uncharacterized protein